MGKPKTIFQDPKYRSIVNVGLFVLITLIIHYTYRYWANTLDYFPISNTMHNLHQWFAEVVFRQSAWGVQHILAMDIHLLDNTMIWPQNIGAITINEGCSGVKQILQFALLMLCFPGPWRKKIWYIPMGMFIIHLVNLFRILVLAEVLELAPDYWHFTHDNIMRPVFYVFIFALWVFWVEKMQVKKENSKK